MTDTQWPRYEVFMMEAPDDSPRYVGSVHAPDAEMALLNARDVFARRPSCAGLWVAPSKQVVFRTAAEGFDGEQIAAPTGEEDLPYLVFRKRSHKGPLELSDRFLAAGPADALRFAESLHQDEPTVMWAVAPENAFVRSSAEERPSFFEPALSKTYKTHSEYKTEAQMLHIRRAKGH